MPWRSLFLALSPVLIACTAAPPPPASAPLRPSEPIAPTLTSASPDAGRAPEHGQEPVITLQPLFGEGAPRSLFPTPAAGDMGCLAKATTTGHYGADYTSLVAACGAPTGFAEYVHPVTGDLHGASDRTDWYAVKLAGGYCYRVFAAGDATIIDLNVRVRSASGTPVAADTTSASIAVAGNTPFCVEKTEDYALDVEVNGPGFGSYEVGVWARPEAK